VTQWIDNLLRRQDGQVILADWDSVTIDPPNGTWSTVTTASDASAYTKTSTPLSRRTGTTSVNGATTRPSCKSVIPMPLAFTFAMIPGDPFSRRELNRRLDSLKNGSLHDRWYLQDR
jgi:hypothetical protein